MKNPQDQIQMTPCDNPLPELEVPMINTMVACLSSEHRKLTEQIMQLACAATRLANDPAAVTANERAVQVWDEIQHALRSHLQIEDGLLSWGNERHAFSGALLDIVKNERLEMRKSMAALRALSSGVNHEPQTAENRSGFAQTLLALAQTLDSHVERYGGEVLPSILRTLSHQQREQQDLVAETLDATLEELVERCVLTESQFKWRTDNKPEAAKQRKFDFKE